LTRTRISNPDAVLFPLESGKFIEHIHDPEEALFMFPFMLLFFRDLSFC